MSMLRRRTSDDKIPVRKAALQALEILAQLRSDGLHKEVSVSNCSIEVIIVHLVT